MHRSAVKTKILHGLISICCYLTSRSAVQWTYTHASAHATYSQLPFGIHISLALPDPLRTGAYRLEIISACA